MPITKCSASKATPAKGINYILDPEKVIARGEQYILPTDPKKMARQMLQTMHMFGKGFDPNERKYYHHKVSFDPEDRPENGGSLTPEKANEYAARYAAKTWPGREVVWAVQDHGTSIHIHFIVAACERDTGKKLDARDAEYRLWKDYAQDLAKEMGLSTLDWRKATKTKKQKERQSREAVDETFAEQGLKARGQATWKDDLRERIDAAVKESCTMSEFKAQLQARGVELTRCTEKTISYRLKGREKGCRGDTLGGDYTVAAIRDALEHNAIEPAPEQNPRGLDAMVSRAERGGNRELNQEERAKYREMGRVAGFKRAEIDEMCDRASWATWDEKQAVWAVYKAARDEFWEEYNIRSQSIQSEINALYKQRKTAKQMEWVLDSRNRRKSLGSVLVAGIYFSRHDDSVILEHKIRQLKQDQERLRKEAAAFKSTTGAAVETLREKGHTLDAYKASIKDMQYMADQLYLKNTASMNMGAVERLRRKNEIRNKENTERS